MKKFVNVAYMISFIRFFMVAFFVRPFYKMMLKKRISLADMESVVGD